MHKILFVLPVAALAACTATVTPRTQAAEVERMQCATGPAGADEIRVLETATVLASQPLYSHVITGNNGSEQRVDGAKIVIRPPDGVSAERMTRILQCHSARQLLGKVDRAQFA